MFVKGPRCVSNKTIPKSYPTAFAEDINNGTLKTVNRHNDNFDHKAGIIAIFVFQCGTSNTV